MDARSQFQIWHGLNSPPQNLVELHTGPLTVMLDGIDVRYIRLDDVEIVRRIYATVRDHNWNTIPCEFEINNLVDNPDSFIVEFYAKHTKQNINFKWHGRIIGDPSGTIRYEMEGKSYSDFLYNRIGLCILHPYKEYGGAEYTVASPEDSIQAAFPELIGPQGVENGHYVALMPPFNYLNVKLEDIEAEFTFEGDLFETEDQRNWTDASFKTYCTPISKGFPYQALPEQAINQSVTLRIRSELPVHKEQPTSQKILTFVNENELKLPQIGFCMTKEYNQQDPTENQLLTKLKPGHIRVDIHLSHENYGDVIKPAIETCNRLGAPLEIALYLEETQTKELKELASLLDGTVRVARVLVFQESAKTATPSETTSGNLIHLVREILASVAPQAQFAGGTDMYFCELNRTRPEINSMDAVCYSIHPQQHAFDDLSIVETLQAQGETVKSAKHFCGEKPIVISPITLKRRSNPNATVEEELVIDGATGLHDSVDPRQMSLFAAGWTLGSVKYLAETGAHSLTYYQLAGWLGLFEPMNAPSRPDSFPSKPGSVFPLYHVFADLTELATSGKVVECKSSNPLEVIGLALKSDHCFSLLVANLTSSTQEVKVDSLVSGEKAYIRHLDDTNVDQASFYPEKYRESKEEVKFSGGELILVLRPYSYSRIDL